MVLVIERVVRSPAGMVLIQGTEERFWLKLVMVVLSPPPVRVHCVACLTLSQTNILVPPSRTMFRPSLVRRPRVGVPQDDSEGGVMMGQSSRMLYPYISTMFTLPQELAREEQRWIEPGIVQTVAEGLIAWQRPAQPMVPSFVRLQLGFSNAQWFPV